MSKPSTATVNPNEPPAGNKPKTVPGSQAEVGSKPKPRATTLNVNDAILTYRYLRISMVAVLVMLAASVLILAIAETCWLGSVSAYYYTPVRNVFVGALVVFGAALVAYHGSTPEEEALLNLSGCMALVVAFVPTGYATCAAPKAADVLVQGLDTAASTAPDPAAVVVVVDAAVSNNLWSLTIASVVAVAIGTIVSAARRPGDSTSPSWAARLRDLLVGTWSRLRDENADSLPGWWINWGRIPLLATCAGIPLAGVVWFVFSPAGFAEAAHFVAAVTMVVGLMLYMFLNATVNDHSAKYARIYGILAGTLVLIPLVIVLAWLVFDFDRVVFYLEFAILGIFVFYWIAQSFELRGQKIEHAPAPR